MARFIYNTKPQPKKLLLLNTSFIFLTFLFLKTYLYPSSSNIVHASTKVLMEACLWGFYGDWIFELQWGPLMVIFHHGDAAEDKGKEVRGGAIH